MNHELAKTLTTALVQFIDRERQEGIMDCSSYECEKIEKAFEGGTYDVVEKLIQRKLTGLTEFESSLRQIIEETLSDEVPNGSGGTMSWAVALSDDDIKKLAPKVLALVKKELLSYADESNPAMEAMADLERTYFCNPDKLPKWLNDDIARKELNAHTKGYNNGYKDAEKKIFSHGEGTYFYSKDGDVTYISPMPVYAPAIPIMPTTPSGWGCDGTHCTNPHHDCINCPREYSSGGTITTPNTASGTSTLKAEG